MTDIVERLRSVQQLGYRTDIGETCNEAAFEIIRLRKALEEAAKVAWIEGWKSPDEISAAIRALQSEER